MNETSPISDEQAILKALETPFVKISHILAIRMLKLVPNAVRESVYTILGVKYSNDFDEVIAYPQTEQALLESKLNKVRKEKTN